MHDRFGVISAPYHRRGSFGGISVIRQILIVDDEPAVRRAIDRYFSANGFQVQVTGSCAEAEEAFRRSPPDVALIDFKLPDGDGVALIQRLRALDAAVPLVILTGHGSIDLAVRAIKEGAEQFFTKPVELPALLVMVERLLESRRDRRRVLAASTRASREVDPFVGSSAAVQALEREARTLARAASPLLLQGETGTGKGVLAAWIHRTGPRSEEAFVELNCAGLSRELVESELFGHEKGAFTGAVSAKLGLLEVAHRGTLFLDEVGDLPGEVQPKLLKVLEEQRFRRVGSVRDRQVDVRLVAATHHDLASLVERGLFRGDLYYRISTLPLFVPPLRERGDDVVALAEQLLRRIGADLGRGELTLSGEAKASLVGRAWPGNVRELRNVLERAALLAERSELDPSDLFGPGATPGPTDRRTSLAEAEARHIAAVLAAEGSVPRAAEVLGLSRSALYEKLRKHGITSPARR